MFKAIDSCIAWIELRVRPGDEDGQALVEYSLIIALIGLGLVGILGLLTGGVEAVFERVVSVL